MNWERKSGLGLGEHQISGARDRSEKSVGILDAIALRISPLQLSPKDDPEQKFSRESRDVAATLKEINDGEHHCRTFSHRLRELATLKLLERVNQPAEPSLAHAH